MNKKKTYSLVNMYNNVKNMYDKKEYEKAKEIFKIYSKFLEKGFFSRKPQEDNHITCLLYIYFFWRIKKVLNIG